METRNNTARNTTLIIGSGPTGLAAALEAVRNSENEIVIVANRKDFTRRQIVGLEKATINYLTDLLGQQKIDDLIKNNVLYFNKRTQYFNISIKNLEKILFASLPKTRRIRFLYTNKSKKVEDTIQVDQDSGKVIVHAEIGIEVFYCRYVVGADGAKHSSGNLFNVPYIDLSNKPKKAQIKPYPYHYTAIYNAPYDDSAHHEKCTASLGYSLFLEGIYNRRAWDYKIIHYTTYMEAGELPTYIHNEKDENRKRELLEKWIGPYRDPNNNVVTPEITFFKSRQEQATVCQVAFSDPKNPSYYLPLGDALCNSFYATSKGCNNGLAGAREFGELLKHENIEQYAENMEKIIATNEDALTTTSQNFDTKIFEEIWPRQLALMEVCELILNDIEKYLAIVARRKCFSFFYDRKISEERENLALLLKSQTQDIFSKLDKNMELINQPGCYVDAEEHYNILNGLISFCSEENQEMNTKNSKLNDIVLAKAKKYLNIYAKGSNDDLFTVNKRAIRNKF